MSNLEIPTAADFLKSIKDVVAWSKTPDYKEYLAEQDKKRQAYEKELVIKRIQNWFQMDDKMDLLLIDGLVYKNIALGGTTKEDTEEIIKELESLGYKCVVDPIHENLKVYYDE